MVMSPGSLTAVVYLKFNHKEAETKPVGERDVVMVSQILDKASGLEPELQELLVRFADFLKKYNLE